MNRVCNFCIDKTRSNVQHGEHFCSYKGRCLRCGHLVDNGFKHGHYECCYPVFDSNRLIKYRKGSHLPGFPYLKSFDKAHLRQLTFEALVVRRLFKAKEFSRWFVQRFIERPRDSLSVERFEKIHTGLSIMTAVCFITSIVLLYYIPVMST